MGFLDQTHAVIQDEWEPAVLNAVQYESVRRKHKPHAVLPRKLEALEPESSAAFGRVSPTFEERESYKSRSLVHSWYDPTQTPRRILLWLGLRGQ